MFPLRGLFVLFRVFVFGLVCSTLFSISNVSFGWFFGSCFRFGCFELALR